MFSPGFVEDDNDWEKLNNEQDSIRSKRNKPRGSESSRVHQ
jgi:hypothetical protein